MPQFNFTCNDCGLQFVDLVTGTEKIICPFCKSTNLEQQDKADDTNTEPTDSSDKTPPSCSSGGCCSGGCC